MASVLVNSPQNTPTETTQSSTPHPQCAAPKSSPSCTLRPEYIPNLIPDSNYVRILDTTLRDGEQAPGASMTVKQKLHIAYQLFKLGVDVIEAGFPASSKDNMEAVKLIAKEVGNNSDNYVHVPVISGKGRCNRADIDAVWEAVKFAKKPRIATFIATSDIHLKHKLGKSRDEVLKIVREMVSYARSLGCNDVQFGAEDATRTDREYLCRVIGEAIMAGATTINICDTVGYTLPTEYAQMITDIKSNIPGIENVILSTHCHNDLGVATANTLAGAYAGARQLETTINGMGERAGNASLEEVVMAIKCRGKELMGGLHTGINTRHIASASKMVAEYSGIHVQPHKAIVGKNAFTHESGIHQDGVLKFRGTYEIISPEDIGIHTSKDSGIVLGKLSGRRGLKSRLLELGYDIDGKELEEIFWRFKVVAEKQKHITDGDLQTLLTSRNISNNRHYIDSKAV